MLKNNHLNKCCFLKNSIYFFAIIAALACLAGCKMNPEKELIKEWYVTAYRTPLADFEGTEPVTVIRLYKGGTYSQFGNYSNYTFGNWRFDKPNRLLILHPVEGKQEILDSYYYISDMRSNEMKVALYRNLPIKPGTEELFFTLQAYANAKTENDPYKPTLHKWRKKPASPETDEQIKERVKNYLSFLKTMYRHTIDNNFNSLSTNWYPNPLLMHYGNGVRMAYSDELDDWNACFYDSAQAVKGYQCISGPFQNITLKSKSGKFERNLDLVEQLLSKIN